MASLVHKPENFPDVLSYLNYRDYLRDGLQALGDADAKYSQRWLAKRIGLKSPQLFSMILSGQRNLTPDLASKLADAFGMSALETEYFQVITELGHATDRDMQERLLARIRTSFQTGLFRLIEDDGKEIYRHWYLPALIEMTTLERFREDVPWLSKCLGISEGEVTAGLKLLIELGFLRRENGRLTRSEPSRHTGDKFYPIVLGRYHLQVLERAFRATAMSRDKRYFEALTIAIRRDAFPELVQRIQRLVREFDAAAESAQGREEVYQLAVQLFPHTDCVAAERMKS
jgi:uncharacterized protein (TIGR02147 family)